MPKGSHVYNSLFKRDKFRCQNCGFVGLSSGKYLQAHHNWYARDQRDPWDYPLSALITLCRMCHEAETWWRAQMEVDLLDALKRRGFLGSDIGRLRHEIEKNGRTLPRSWEAPEERGSSREEQREKRRKQLEDMEPPE